MVTTTVVQVQYPGYGPRAPVAKSSPPTCQLEDVEQLLAVTRGSEWRNRHEIPSSYTLSRMLYGLPGELVNPVLSRFRMLRQFDGLLGTSSSSELEKILGCPLRRTPRVVLTPTAYVVYLDGWDYGEYADAARIRTRFDPVSFGVRPATSNFPADLRGSIVVVNTGDGNFGIRPEADITGTRDHELSHVLYGLVFQKDPFVTREDTANRLKTLSQPHDEGAHAIVAHWVRRGMEAWAHTEIIAYGLNRRLTPSRVDLGQHFWSTHHSEVGTYLGSWTPGDAVASNSISRAYRAAETLCEANVDRYLAYSRNVFRSFTPLRAEALLLTTPFGL